MNATFASSSASYTEFAPPPAPALLRSAGVAITAHVLLAIALAWGVSWQRQSNEVAFEAELWSQTPQQAAPAAIPPPPEPQTAPVKSSQPEQPALKDADIRVEQDKAREKAKRLQQEKIEEQKREAARQENIRRMLSQAGQGSPNSTGSAQQSSTSSAGYQAIIRARVIPQITFPERDTVSGNPVARVQFRIAPDGTIITSSIRVVQASGLPAWDRAVANAIEKTQTIPRDKDGRFPDNFFELTFRVKE
ncbi:MAG: hypothetical protein RLZZ271_280 [Pseudomonadota bacterium]|jgi:colicin import membrane protein